MKHPTKDECFKLLNEYNTPKHVQNHCRAVATTAYTIGKALNEKGYNLDLELIIASGLLHDIARVEDKHWEIGANFVSSLGYEKESEIIRQHMTYSTFSPIEQISELDLVCLGDRLVKEDKYVGLDDRMDYIIDKALKNGHPEAKSHILRKKEEVRRFMEQIENVIGISIDELMVGNTESDLCVQKTGKQEVKALKTGE